MLHATEPYTAITRTPLAICDPGLAAGASENLASTIDLAPTCLALLSGIDEPMTFAHSGIDLLADARAQVFAQNLTANQAAIAAFGIAQAFAVADRTWCLLASARGLELYAYRLDPGNHCNLLHFFDLAPGGRLALRPQPGAAGHYRGALDDNPRAVASLTESFTVLRTALAARVAAKRDYILGCGVDPVHALEPRCLDIIDDDARAAFFRLRHRGGRARAAIVVRIPVQARVNGGRLLRTRHRSGPMNSAAGSATGRCAT